MHALEWLWPIMALSDSSSLPLPVPLFGYMMFGYMGLGQGPELIPYFAALVSFVGAALVAVLQYPLSVLLGRFKARRLSPHPQQADAASPSQGQRDAADGTNVGGRPS